MVAISCVRPAVAGRYTCERDRTPKDFLQLAGDGSFTLQEDEATITGTYKVEGLEIGLTTQDRRKLRMRVEGAVLVEDTGGRGDTSPCAGP